MRRLDIRPLQEAAESRPASARARALAGADRCAAARRERAVQRAVLEFQGSGVFESRRAAACDNRNTARLHRSDLRGGGGDREIGQRPKGCRVACLVTTPFLFQSEVTLFFDEDYFRTFLPVSEAKRTEFDGGLGRGTSRRMPPRSRCSRRLRQGGWTFYGGTMLREYNELTGAAVERVNWVWAFNRSLMSIRFGCQPPRLHEQIHKFLPRVGLAAASAVASAIETLQEGDGRRLESR